MSAPADPRELLAQLVIRLRAAPEDERPAVVAELLPLLTKGRIPVNVRLAAAGRAIDALPDDAKSVRPVVRAITTGLSPARALDRLRHLQHLTEKATALDTIVALRERRVKMTCPRCGLRAPRAEMAKHLWHEHDLTLVDGKTRTHQREVEMIRREYTTAGNPDLFDRVAELGGEPAMRAWAAQTASEEESLPLCAAARERGVGLCPRCFADTRPRVPDLPPRLAVTHGRVAGDGHVATTPTAIPVRVSATLVAVVFLVVFVMFGRVALGFAFVPAVYLLTLTFRSSRKESDDLAIDAAWRKLAPRLADRRDADRFLTRLCLTSIGRGDPMERANTLSRVIARARDNPAERQLLAVSLTLQTDDGGQFGRDRVAGIADLVAMGLRGEQPTDFAEFVLTAYLSVPREPAERERLRILLHAAAFAADYSPRDVIDLCDAAPHIAEAMRLAPHHLALLYGVWKHRPVRPWATIGEAQTVFDLAAQSPTTARKLLTRDPGLLLVCESPPEVQAELGPVLIAVSGISIGGASILDPDAEIAVDDDEQTLIFGKQTFHVSQEIPAEFADALKEWLHFRSEKLAAFPAMYLSGETRRASRFLTPFVVRCSSCGTQSAPVVGLIARPLQL